METNKRIKISSLFMTMLIVSLLFVSPALACAPGSSCGGDSILGDPVDLTGEDQDELVEMTMASSQVQKLDAQLVAEGYSKQKVETYSVPSEGDDGTVVDIQVTAIRYKSTTAKDDKQTIMYAYNPSTGSSIIVLGTGWDCTLCASGLAACGGCVLACEIVGPGCIVCIAAACPATLYQCTVCCCSLGNDWCCDRLDW